MLVPAYASLFRWTNELYYLMMVAPYHPLPSTLALYGYHTADMGACIMMIIYLAVAFRVFAYLAVVRKEV